LHNSLQHCRLCHAQQLDSFISLERSPRQLSRLLTEGERSADECIPLAAFRCQTCGFVQLLHSHPAVDYEDYVLSWMHIRTLRLYREALAADFASRYGLSGKAVLDVGCGSGEFLGCLQNYGISACGLEPSSILVERARHSGFNVIHGLATRALLEREPLFHGWTCLQVLEHIPAPVEFLTVLRRSLIKGGVGLIEVPRLEFIIAEDRFYDFFGDHVNYFTDSTLRLTCEMAGFRVLRTHVGFDNQFLIAEVTPAEELYLEDFSKNVVRVLAEVRAWLSGQFAAQRRVAVWGAGYKSIAAIAECNIPGIQYVIDSDPNKHGFYTPGSHLQIHPPAILMTDPVDAILLAAVAYKKEILAQIRGELGFVGQVVALGPELEVL
jgi:SAM-dependent methyltransferase